MFLNHDAQIAAKKMRFSLRSKLNTFPQDVVIFFAEIIIYDMLKTGKKIMWVFQWNIAQE